MSESGGFYTLKGYQDQEEPELTTAMEDYLEMICRLMRQSSVVRIGQLAESLHVTPPSASKMIRQLRMGGYILAEKYGYILLTDKGRQAGEYLLYRHGVLQRFLRLLNQSEDELEQVEKIEHFLNRRTIRNLDQLAARLETEQSAPPG